MDFDVLEDDGITAVLSPLRVSILHSGFQVQLDDRLRAMAKDVANIEAIRARSPELAEAVEAHAAEVAKGVNSKDLRRSADRLIAVKSELFGLTNAGSAITTDTRTAGNLSARPATQCLWTPTATRETVAWRPITKFQSRNYNPTASRQFPRWLWSVQPVTGHPL